MWNIMCVLLFIFYVCLLQIVFSSDSVDFKSSLATRNSRVFFLFPLFTPFRRKACLAGASQSQRGVCYTAYQCNLRGGIASGTCASGRGVCCIFQYSCGGVSNAQNYTYFTNPNYPSVYAGGTRCSITINKATFSVCQLKINMLDLTLAPPTAEGICSNDFFSTSGSSIRLCGINKGQHLYVDTSASSYSLSIDTNSGYTFDRSWNLEIIQIPCASGVPAGCTQYFNSTSGSVTSFNYGATASASTNPINGLPGNRQIAGLNYGVCVKPVSGYCNIEWSQSSSSSYSFSVSGNTNMIDSTMLGTSAVALGGMNCSSNFIIIPNPSQNGARLLYDRFCGNGFNTTTSNMKPYTLYVTASAPSTSSDIGNRGFSLNYRLLPC